MFPLSPFPVECRITNNYSSLCLGYNKFIAILELQQIPCCHCTASCKRLPAVLQVDMCLGTKCIANRKRLRQRDWLGLLSSARRVTINGISTFRNHIHRISHDFSLPHISFGWEKVSATHHDKQLFRL